MNPETLERLMLDRALGSLPPDCDALLTSYLETRPEAAETCRRMELTVDLARSALADARAARLPAFPAERLLRTQRSQRIWRLTMGVTGVAASILIGLVVHATLFRPPPSNPRAPGLSGLAQATPRHLIDENQDRSGFWSGRQFYERAAHPQPQPSKRLIWNSPVAVPQVGDST